MGKILCQQSSWKFHFIEIVFYYRFEPECHGQNDATMMQLICSFDAAALYNPQQKILIGWSINKGEPE